VEQVHIIAGNPEDVTIVYVTQTAMHTSVLITDSLATPPLQFNGSRQVYSAMQYGAAGNGWVYDWEDGYDDDVFPVPPKNLYGCGPAWKGYSNVDCIYTSDYVHQVTVTGLTPGTRYWYQPSGANKWRSFKTSPAIGHPVSFGLVADLGQTTDSVVVMQRLKARVDSGDIDAIIFPGDISYADGYANAWDNYGRLSEFLFEAVPTAYGVGNHEFANEQFVHYKPRYPAPVSRTVQSDSSFWYSYETGLAHVITLCFYCDVSPGSPQYKFVVKDLAALDRSRTPWLVVSMHVPLYSSFSDYMMVESAAFRTSLEPLLYAAKADVVFAGHVHAYERTDFVYNGTATCDAPMYITVGDGGNNEGPSCWGNEVLEWTAFRESSFGYGIFDIQNETHGMWTWHRNSDGNTSSADSIALQTSSTRCSPVVI
jgi:hypothetical protein